MVGHQSDSCSLCSHINFGYFLRFELAMKKMRMLLLFIVLPGFTLLRFKKPCLWYRVCSLRQLPMRLFVLGLRKKQSTHQAWIRDPCLQCWCWRWRNSRRILPLKRGGERYATALAATRSLDFFRDALFGWMMLRRAARSRMLSALVSSVAIAFVSLLAIAKRIAFKAPRSFLRHTSFTARWRSFFRSAFSPACNCGIYAVSQKGAGMSNGACL